MGVRLIRNETQTPFPVLFLSPGSRFHTKGTVDERFSPTAPPRRRLKAINGGHESRNNGGAKCPHICCLTARRTAPVWRIRATPWDG
jgi:hypothetical protein